VLVLAAPVLAATAAVKPLVAQVQQRGQVRVRRHPHMAAVAAVAAVRTSLWNELLAPKAHAAPAAVTGLHRDLDLVDKLHEDLVRHRCMTDGRETRSSVRDEIWECGKGTSIEAAEACLHARGEDSQAGTMATRLRDRPQR